MLTNAFVAVRLGKMCEDDGLHEIGWLYNLCTESVIGAVEFIAKGLFFVITTAF
jgi:hypothetical protein